MSAVEITLRVDRDSGTFDVSVLDGAPVDGAPVGDGDMVVRFPEGGRTATSVSDGRRKLMFALWNEARTASNWHVRRGGEGERQARLDFYAGIVGRSVGSWHDLACDEQEKILDALAAVRTFQALA